MPPNPNPNPNPNPQSEFDRKRKLDDSDSFPAEFRRLSAAKSKSAVDSGAGAGCSSSQVQFFVRMISGGKTLVLQANLHDTVELVHQKIQLITRIPVAEQRLIYNGKQLQWEQTLEECRVQNDAGLQLVGRMRSTDHPRAWRVINDVVSVICRLCRNEAPNYSTNVVKVKLEQYMALPLKPNDKFASVFLKTKVKRANKRKESTNGGEDDGDGDEDVEDEERGEEGEDECGSINKIDYCKIFMDACAPQALVMLYVSSDKCNRDCADACIRSFVGFVRYLGSRVDERCFCAAVVLEFCKLLRPVVAEGDGVYLSCRCSLGMMLEKIELGSGPKDVYGIVGTSVSGTTCVSVQDVFPFFKEVGMQLMRDMEMSADRNAKIGALVRTVSDFAAFLQPMLGFVRRRLAAGVVDRKGDGKVGPLGEEVDHLFGLCSDLLGEIDRCLGKIEPGFGKKKEKDFKLYQNGWSQYLGILKELSSISMLSAYFENQLLTIMTQKKEALCGLVLVYANRLDDYSWLRKYKYVLNFESRRHLALLMFPEVREDYEELHEMLIDRSQLLPESFEYISHATPSGLHAGLFVEFKNEEATGPGVLREWFCLVCQAIFDPENALFAACPLDRRRFFPNPASKVDLLHLKYFRFSGRVIALAMMHKIQIGVVLDRIFFLQLAGRRVSVEDIKDADPCLYSSCKQILEMDAEFVDSDGLGLTFVSEVEELGSRRVVELCPGGREVAVNSQNRKDYVDLIVKHHFVQSISEQISSFAKGFADILYHGKLRETFFQSLELEDLDMMLHGSGSEISVEDWKAHTKYDGYKESDPQIVWFWEVLSQLNAKQKTALLFFWTSVKYLPIEGFRGLGSRLFIYKSSESQEHLPTSHTCFYRLCIPPYPSKTVMEDRLHVITQDHVGCSFGSW